MAGNSIDSNLEYPIDQQLLEDATHAREVWRVIKDRLVKIEEHKDQVSKAVYKRVHADYKGKLDEATEAVLKKKAEIDRELKSLGSTRNKISIQLEEHRQKLEEIKFRNTLGEYGEQEYQEAARSEQDKISKFETVLGAVGNNIERYESIFRDDAELFEAGAKAPAPKTISRMAEAVGLVPPHAEEPLTDEEGYVVEEGGPDYFTAAAEETDAKIEASVTSKARAPAVEKEERVARVVIIKGGNAGVVYPIKGTVSFGRSEKNTVTLKNAKVSRQHAQIQQQGGDYVLVDLNSSNGTFVNGERIEEHVLSNGDEIKIGDTVLQFQV